MGRIRLLSGIGPGLLGITDFPGHSQSGQRFPHLLGGDGLAFSFLPQPQGFRLAPLATEHQPEIIPCSLIIGLAG